MGKTKNQLFNLVFCSVMVALACALSIVKIWQMPLGGEITLFSLVPLILVSWMMGVNWGLASCYVFSTFRIAADLKLLLSYGLSVKVLMGSFVFDYIVAFTVIGLVGLFREKGEKWLYISSVVVLLIRFISHIISGVILFKSFSPWKNALLYSICYNGTFLLPELILTIIGLFVLVRSGAVKRIKSMIK